MGGFVTIDPEGTTEFDDALRFTELGSGRFRLEIMLPHPAEIVMSGWEESRALLLAQTTYYNSSSRRMIPDRAVQRASLVAKKERKVLIFTREYAMVDPTLPDLGVGCTKQSLRQAKSVGEFEISENISYAEAQRRFAAGEEGWRMWASFSKALLQARRARGQLAVYDIDFGWSVDENGVLKELDSSERNCAYMIVRESMMEGNTGLTEWTSQHGVNIIYRSQTAHGQNEEEASALLSALVGSHNKIYAKEDIEALAKRYTHLAKPAYYSHLRTGHLSLGLPLYARFTSPIRRYADLVNLRQVVRKLMSRPPLYDQILLARIAPILTELEQFDKEMKRQKEKDNVRRQAAAAADGEDSITAMGQNTYHQAIMAAIAAERIPTALADSIGRRELSPKAMLRLIAAPHDSPRVRCATVALLPSHPEDATNMLYMGAALHYWGAPAINVEQSGLPHEPTFSCSISTGDYNGVSVGARTRKQAISSAACDFFENVANSLYTSQA